MKRIILVCMLAVSCLALWACGGSEKPSGNNNDNNTNNTQQENNNGTDAEDEGSYVFVVEGVEVSVNEDISAVINKIGDPVSYFEAPSCAFEGMDKIYTYGSFRIDTYPSGDKDLVASIYFLDDIVETKEGLCIYMTKDEMIEIYGEATTVQGNEYVYEKGNGAIHIILDGDEIISIEYRTKVEYN